MSPGSFGSAHVVAWIPGSPGDLTINSGSWTVYHPRGRGGPAGIRQSADYKAAKQSAAMHVKRCLLQTGARPIPSGPVAAEVAVFAARRHRTGPASGLGLVDADGPLKGLCDALELAGVIGNDAQIVDVTSRKWHDAQNPGIAVALWPTNVEECPTWALRARDLFGSDNP